MALLCFCAASATIAPAHLDQFRILSITTRSDAVVIQFDLSSSAP